MSKTTQVMALFTIFTALVLLAAMLAAISTGWAH